MNLELLLIFLMLPGYSDSDKVEIVRFIIELELKNQEMEKIHSQ